MCTNVLLAIPSLEALPPGDESTPGPIVGSVYVSARCLEMPGVIEQSLYVVKAGEAFPMTETTGFQLTRPLHWTSTQDFVGIAPSGGVQKGGSYSTEHAWDNLPTFNDGMNTAGLSVGALWLSPGTTYPAPGSTTYFEVSFLDFPAWVLGNFTSAADVAAALGAGGATPQVTIVGPPPPTPQQASPFYVPLHYIITDATGASIVVEFVNGETMIHGSDNGVMTNAPTYDWQCTNVRNYGHLSSVNNPTSVTGVGQVGGSGMVGLPGDSTPASRFVKAWYLSQGYDLLPKDGRGWLPAPGGIDPAGGDPSGFAYAEQTVVTAALQLVQIAMGTPTGCSSSPWRRLSRRRTPRYRFPAR
jgi:choloylglycine hydrolase